MMCRNTKLFAVMMAIVLASSMSANADTFVLDFGYTTTDANAAEGTSLGDYSNTAQVVYDSSLLTGLAVGDQITALAFRLNVNDARPIWTLDDYQIRLSTSLNPAGSLDTTLANNRGSDYTVVRSGRLRYNGTEYSNLASGDEANEFGQSITFDIPFTYSGGDLLLEFTHSVRDNGRGASADAAYNLDTSLVQWQAASGYDGDVATFHDGGFSPIISFTTITPTSSVPTPAALPAGLALLGLMTARRRRR